MSGASFIDHFQNGQPDLSSQVPEIFFLLRRIRHIPLNPFYFSGLLTILMAAGTWFENNNIAAKNQIL
jgi:hypothetical protein